MVSRCRRCARRSWPLTGGDESPAAVAAAVEFVLEGLHLSKRLNKDAAPAAPPTAPAEGRNLVTQVLDIETVGDQIAV